VPSGKTTIVDSLSSRLSELGTELPKPPTPPGAYVDSSETGNLLFLSGTLLVVNGKLASTMQARGGTLRRLGPGQVFYESPEDVHTVSRNASKTKPAKFIVFFIKNEGAPILTPIH